MVSLINEFSSVSSYSVNWFKSLILPLSYSFQPRSSIPLQPLNLSESIFPPSSEKMGVLELPNVDHYFLTISVHPWVNIEQVICKEIIIYDLPFISGLMKIINQTMNNQKTLANSHPLGKILISCKTKIFSTDTWKLKGITHIEHIMKDGTCIPFQDIKDKFGIRVISIDNVYN